MKNNTLIRLSAAIVSASILFSVAGCGKTEEKEKDLELNQLVVENSTAVIEYTSIDDKGQEVSATTVADVNAYDLNVPATGISLKEMLQNESQKRRFEMSKESYGLTDKEYEQIIAEADKWATFSYDFYVANSTAKRIAFANLEHTDKDGILIESDLGCEYGIASGHGLSIVFEGLVDSRKYSSEDELKKALSEMNIQILYTFVKSMDDNVEDWSKVEIRKMSIDFTK